jgi:hypothetical protein
MCVEGVGEGPAAMDGRIERPMKFLRMDFTKKEEGQ